MTTTRKLWVLCGFWFLALAATVIVFVVRLENERAQYSAQIAALQKAKSDACNVLTGHLGDSASSHCGTS